MEDIALNALKDKEKQLRKELEASEVYKNWHAISTAISVFQGNKIQNTNPEDVSKSAAFVDVYDQNYTWQEKVIFAVRKIDSGFINNIVDELKKHDEEKDENTILQRVQGAVSALLKNHKLHVIQRSGKRIKVALKI